MICNKKTKISNHQIMNTAGGLMCTCNQYFGTQQNYVTSDFNSSVRHHDIQHQLPTLSRLCYPMCQCQLNSNFNKNNSFSVNNQLNRQNMIP